MKITYLHHSGYVVELDQTVLVFDYYTQNGQFKNFDPFDKKYNKKQLYVFATHNHADHYDQAIYAWNDRANYIISNDIMEFRAKKMITVSANRMYNYDSLLIYTFRSTDEGVAFLVRAEGKTIFHSGDLNWWHWDGEPDQFNKKMGFAYESEIDELARLLNGVALDAAMIPVDGRLGHAYSWACDYFVKKVKVNNIFPMHFWGQFGICEPLQEKHPDQNICMITHENQTFEL